MVLMSSQHAVSFSYEFESSMTLCNILSPIWSLKLMSSLLFSGIKYAISISFSSPAFFLLTIFEIPKVTALSAGTLCTTCFRRWRITSCNILVVFGLCNPCILAIQWMPWGMMGFYRSILSFWGTQTLQIIVFHSVIARHLCLFFSFF